MPEKIRVNLMLTKTNHERLRELRERVPGVTMSDVVNEVLDGSLPSMEAMLDKADELGRDEFLADEEAQEDTFTRVMAQQMVEKMFGTQEEFIHTLMKIGGAVSEKGK